MARHVVVVDLVGAVPAHFDDPPLFPELARLFRTGGVRPLEPVFPALTCPVQVSLVTGALPAQHGIIANGLFNRDQRRAALWTWPAARIERPTVWEMLRTRMPRAKTAALFLQGLKGTRADIYINPHPKHTPDGETVPWCDSNPPGLYEQLVRQLGHFPLHKYWGPLADIESSRWILNAALRTLAQFKPELSLVYVPHLDYVGQRAGPHDEAFAAEARVIDAAVAEFVVGLKRAFAPSEPRVLLVSEYAMAPVSRAACPNRALRDAGLLVVKDEDGAEVLDLAASRAFAMVDHQCAHVYAEPDAVGEAAEALAELDGAAEVCRGERLRQLGVAHPNAGELVLLAEPDAWFAYYWWHDPGRAPAFARTVDIHRKPGYDPVELFFDADAGGVPLEPGLVRGSHGLPPEGVGGCGVLACVPPLPSPSPKHVTQMAGTLLGLLISAKS